MKEADELESSKRRHRHLSHSQGQLCLVPVDKQHQCSEETLFQTSRANEEEESKLSQNGSTATEQQSVVSRRR